MNKKISKLLREYEKEEIIYLNGVNKYSKDVINIINSNIKVSNNKELNNMLNELFKDNIKLLLKCNNIVLLKENICFFEDNTLVINEFINKDNIINYDIKELINYEEIRNIIINNNIKILYVGSNYYSRFIDYRKLREIINEVNGKLIVDITNILEYVINNRIESPSSYAHLIIFNILNYTCLLSNNIINIDNNYDINYKLGILQYLLELKEIDIDKINNNINDIIRSFKDNNLNIISDGTDNNLIRIKVNNSEEISNILKLNNIIVNYKDKEIIINMINGNYDKNYYDIGNKISHIIKERGMN